MNRAVLRKALSIFLIVSVAAGLAYGLSRFLTVENYGIIRAVGISVYEDSQCTKPLTVIDWGLVAPNSTATRNFWLRNEGNVPVTVSMQVQDWSPANASSFMSVTWNREGVVVAVNETVYCFFTLEIFANATAITEFNFNILLVGSEA